MCDGCIESALILLKSGADPKKRDGLGYSSLDYAYDRGWDFEFLLPWDRDYIPIDHSVRQPLIRSQIFKNSSALLAIQDQYIKYEFQWEYNRTLLCLTCSLERYGQAESLEDTTICYVVMLNQLDCWQMSWALKCEICRAPLENCSAYRCCSCANLLLCPGCYGEFAGPGKGKEQETALQNYEVLLKLEAQVRRVKAMCEAIRHDGWLFAESFLRDNNVKEWVSNKLKQYKD